MGAMWYERRHVTPSVGDDLSELGRGGVTDILTKAWRTAGAQVRVINASRMTGRGWPDRYVASRVIPGGCWVEVKIGGGKLSDAQRDRLALLIAEGDRAVVMWCRKSVINERRRAICVHVCGPNANVGVELEGSPFEDGKKLLVAIRDTLWSPAVGKVGTPVPVSTGVNVEVYGED